MLDSSQESPLQKLQPIPHVVPLHPPFGTAQFPSTQRWPVLQAASFKQMGAATHVSLSQRCPTGQSKPTAQPLRGRQVPSSQRLPSAHATLSTHGRKVPSRHSPAAQVCPAAQSSLVWQIVGGAHRPL